MLRLVSIAAVDHLVRGFGKCTTGDLEDRTQNGAHIQKVSYVSITVDTSSTRLSERSYCPVGIFNGGADQLSRMDSDQQHWTLINIPSEEERTMKFRQSTEWRKVT